MAYSRLFSVLCWLIVLFLVAGHVRAEPAAEGVLAWDCWIHNDNINPVNISCIRDRGDLAAQSSVEPNEDMEALLLDNIHYRIHGGDTSEIGKLISDHVEVLQKGSIWSIDIHIAPFDSSWDEERPQILVRTLLCPGHLTCAVNIKRPPSEQKPATDAKKSKKKKQRSK